MIIETNVEEQLCSGALQDRVLEGKPFRVAIIGGGISGLSTALALLQSSKSNKIKVTVFERDDSFDARKPGYGLTLTYSLSGALASLKILEDCARYDTP